MNETLTFSSAARSQLCFIILRNNISFPLELWLKECWKNVYCSFLNKQVIARHCKNLRLLESLLFYVITLLLTLNWQKKVFIHRCKTINGVNTNRWDILKLSFTFDSDTTEQLQSVVRVNHAVRLICVLFIITFIWLKIHYCVYGRAVALLRAAPRWQRSLSYL